MREWGESRQGEEGAEEASTRTLSVPVCTVYALNLVLLSWSPHGIPIRQGSPTMPTPHGIEAQGSKPLAQKSTTQ